MGVGVGVGSSDARRACGSRPWSPWTRACVVPVGQLRWALTPWWWPPSSTLQALGSHSPSTPSWLLTESWGCTAAHTLTPRAGQFPVLSQVWAGVCTPLSTQNKPPSGCLPSLPPKPQIKTDLGGNLDPSSGTSVAVLCGISGWLVGPPGVPALPQNSNPVKHGDPHMGVTVTSAH